MNKKKPLHFVILSKLFGIIVFLLMLFIANYLLGFIQDTTYSQIVYFLNVNIVFILIMSLVFGIGEIFHAMIFPFNLPGPLFSAFGGVLIVIFLEKIFSIVDTITGQNISAVFFIFHNFVYMLLFFIILIIGYVSIFADLFSSVESPGVQKEQKNIKRERIIEVKPVKTWKEIGDEFRKTIYDFLSMLRRSFRRKK